MKPSFNTTRLIIRPYGAKDFKCWRKAYSEMMKAQNEWDLDPRSDEELSKANFRKLLKFRKISEPKKRFMILLSF